MLNMQPPESSWVERCAVATIREKINVEALQEYYNSIGLFNFRFIPLGAREVLLEFESKSEMEETIDECLVFLEHRLQDIRPCDVWQHGVSH